MNVQCPVPNWLSDRLTKDDQRSFLFATTVVAFAAAVVAGDDGSRMSGWIDSAMAIGSAHDDLSAGFNAAIEAVVGQIVGANPKLTLHKPEPQS